MPKQISFWLCCGVSCVKCISRFNSFWWKCSAKALRWAPMWSKSSPIQIESYQAISMCSNATGESVHNFISQPFSNLAMCGTSKHLGHQDKGTYVSLHMQTICIFYRFDLVYWQAGKWFYFTNFNGSIDWYCVNPYYPQFECNKSSGTIAQTMFCLVVVSRRGDSTCKKSQNMNRKSGLQEPVQKRWYS